MRVFVDSSALYAALDEDDRCHRAAASLWRRLLDKRSPLWTHSYVLIEVMALIQARLGLEAVRRLVDDWLPVIEVLWIDAPVHHTAVAEHLAAGRRRVSLVDRISFHLMRATGTRSAFAFDGDFEAEGFKLLKTT